MNKPWIIVGCALFCLKLAAQQSTTIIDAEFRPKTILNNGYKTPITTGQKPFGYISQRTRINIHHTGNKLDAYFSIQDVRYWGGEDNFNNRGVYGDTRSVDLHQAWFRYKPFEHFSVKVGRQLFSYDDQRILAGRNWNDYQVGYDAVLFVMDNDKNQVDMAFSWNADNTSNALYTPVKFKTLDFIRYERKYDALSASLIGLITGNTVSDTTTQLYFRSTAGVNITYSKDKIDLRGSMYYQNNMNDRGAECRAYVFSVSGKYAVIGKILNISAGLDYISGHDATNTGSSYQTVNHTFDLLYGKRHGFYGYMDYFNTPPDQGLQDYMVKVNYRPAEKITVKADYHHFLLSADRYDPEFPAEKLDRNLGDEIDLVLEWKPLKEMVLQAGYCFYLTTSSLEKLKNVYPSDTRFPQFAYLMITVKPQLLFYTKE